MKYKIKYTLYFGKDTSRFNSSVIIETKTEVTQENLKIFLNSKPFWDYISKYGIKKESVTRKTFTFVKI